MNYPLQSKRNFEDIQLAERLEKREHAYISMRNEFTGHTLNRAINREISEMVEKAKVAQEIDLNEKRRR